MQFVDSRIVWVIAAMVGIAIITGVGAAQVRQLRRIVFEVTGDGAQAWEAALNNVESAQKTIGRDITEIRVVAHGKASA